MWPTPRANDGYWTATPYLEWILKNFLSKVSLIITTPHPTWYIHIALRLNCKLLAKCTTHSSSVREIKIWHNFQIHLLLQSSQCINQSKLYGDYQEKPEKLSTLDMDGTIMIIEFLISSCKPNQRARISQSIIPTKNEHGRLVFHPPPSYFKSEI